MRFTLKKDKSGVVIVGVEGQLIVGNRQELKQKVLDALEDGSRKFVIDFSKTGYIDSSGLGVLVSLSKKIREQGGELRLAGLNADLQTLFELTKLDTLFPSRAPPRRRWRRSDVSLQLHVTRDAMRLDVPSDLGMGRRCRRAGRQSSSARHPLAAPHQFQPPHRPRRSARQRDSLWHGRGSRSGRQCQRRAGARRRADPRRG